MDLRYSDEEIAFREEVREFFRTTLPNDIRRKGILGQRFNRDDIVRATLLRHERGWATPSWPVEWGGTGWNAVKQYIFKEETYIAGAPEPLGFNVNMIGPVIIAFGTEEQKKHFLPKIARLDYWFCQGFSEPGAGSDLASLRTQAVRDGDHYVVNGQKIWTTLAHFANWCFLLVRTDPTAKKRQQGITYLLVEMNTPGITVRPIITIDGHHEFNEVFFDNVRIPVANRIGEENKGWDYAKYLLGHERGGVARVGLCKLRLQRTKEFASRINVDGRPLSENQSFRERITALEIDLKALEMLQLRALSDTSHARAGKPDPMAPILKIRGSELQQATTELQTEVAGYAAMEFDADFVGGGAKPLGGEDWALTVAPNQYWLRHTTISAGTNEIQRNVLAKSVLEL
ncbi:MAG: pimeloyl-CoA dehydrogenase large subunit [Rhodospirillaceae bacterium]|nr:MAG: pimeloyl-CoA dehydrogenase large subunit [Rhodospirillaceae bacterium]